MEIRKTDVEEFKQGRQTINKDFYKLQEFIIETKHGVILINDKLKEKRFKRKDINNLFYLLNESNIKEVKYIPHEANMFLIAEIKVITNDSEEYLIQLDKHHVLYQ